jgi:hypothetical protein
VNRRPLGILRAGLPAVATVALTFAAVAVGALLFPGPAEAHGLIGRGDLPLPGWLLSWGAALLLIGSFAALVLAWREPKLEGDTWRPLGRRLSALLVNPATELLAGVFGVAMLVLVVYSGLEGVDAPDRNFSVTFVFVTFWLGVVVASIFFGDVFRPLNPWRAIARAVSGLFRLVAGQRAPAPLAYPERLGRWPAVAGLVAFLWFELVWGQSGFAASGVAPEDVAIATLIYSVITFAGMGLFGIEAWASRGETFSVYFGMFASLAPLEVRDGRLGRRRPLEGAGRWAAAPAGATVSATAGTTLGRAGIAGSLALVLAAIGGTSFDGAQEGALSGTIAEVFEWLTDAGLAPVTALRLTNSFFLALSMAVVAGIFWIGIRGMRTIGRDYRPRELGRLFAHVFIPIALAYLVAHYFSLLVFQEQAQFTYLLSDPLGTGEDIFGTASGAIDYTAVGATTIQWVQFGSIVVGHALALALGHDRALRLFGSSRDASWSQVWMLVVMLMFSTLGLYLLTQANA